eukprot:gnl/MRDRNA2_/MRDRNA2_27719_c0_seq1.p1 gnl/MRDRNA2_/MRDRNA2_27719_c0~~gnl/MRDRNA2_/MRDRNA2_27719_c0_seq1.p1  ORF type:complete len:621 (+),score=120.22 gnl/MRDRNA2_/MRDRNA2_27719_c0_seq1:47-1909(+)
MRQIVVIVLGAAVTIGGGVDRVLRKLVDRVPDHEVKLQSVYHTGLDSTVLGKTANSFAVGPRASSVNPADFSSPSRLPVATRPRPRRVGIARAADEMTAGFDVLKWIRESGGGASVRPGIDSTGVRGLIVDRPVKTGSVLLEVPLSLAICVGTKSRKPLTGATAEWTWKLPSNVQLALAVLERRGTAEETGEFDPFLASWPKVAPPLPVACNGEELALATNQELSSKVSQASSWVDEQYKAAYKAFVDEYGEGLYFPPVDQFRDALAMVWSRNLKGDENYGVESCLVPGIDLANHESMPSAMQAFTKGYVNDQGKRSGPLIRLYSSRPLEPGDAVTITYGFHGNTDFALYYGFVPTENPFDNIRISLADIVSATPTDLLGPEPQGGYTAGVMKALAESPEELQAVSDTGKWSKDAQVIQQELLQRKFELRAAAPSLPLLNALVKLLPGGHAAAARTLEIAVAAVEKGLWNYPATSLDELDAQAQSALFADERELDSASNGKTSLTEQAQVLLRLRLERRRLLLSLRRAMSKAAKRCSEDSRAGSQELEVLAKKFDEYNEDAKLSVVYPSLLLDAVNSYEEREWDWDENQWVIAKKDVIDKLLDSQEKNLGKNFDSTFSRR